MAKSPDVALSYAETSENAPEKHYNSGIVIYKVKKSNLNSEKIQRDSNVRGDEENDHTVEYHDNIHPKHLEMHSEHDT